MGGLVFTSGQIPVDPATGAVAEGIAAQADQSCRNVGAILEAAGVGFDKVVKTTCFLADIADFAAFNEVYAKYFTSKPARSCVAVKDLPKGVLCEIEAIAEACRTLGGWRLWQCTLYVTLEPCPMCAGAIMNARIPRIVYGAKDTVNGCCGSAVDLFMLPCSQKPEIVSGVLEEEASALLSGFFRRLREKRKKSDGVVP